MADSNSEVKTIAKGDLAKTPFAHLLIYLDRRRLSGSLALWAESAPGELGAAELILIRNGRPVGACFNQKATSLENGLLKIFTLEQAAYAFYEGNLLGGRSGRLDGKIEPLALITQSLRGPTRDEVVDSVLRRLGSARLRMQTNIDLARYRFEPRERGLLELLQAEPSNLEELIRGTALPERRSRRLIYLLLITNAVAPFDEASDRPPEGDNDEERMGDPPREAHAQRGHGRNGAVTGLQSLSFPAVGTHSSSPAPAVITHSSSPAPAEHGAAGGARTVSARSVSSRRPPAAREGDDPLAPNLPASRDSRLGPIPAPPPSLDPELTRRWQEIGKTVETIEQLTYFQMLGIKKEAAPDEIRDAFFALAKKWHPDRLPADLRPLRPQVEAVFAYLSEAHACLTDEERRATYMQSVKEGGGTPAAERLMQRVIDAALSFPKVEVLARQQMFDEALALLDKIIEMTGGEPDYYAMRAWILLQKHPGADAPFDLMLSYIDKAIVVNKKHERAHFTRGMILKRMGRVVEALRHFKLVADMNPKHTEAARELRLAAMRKQTVDKLPATGGEGGLFSGLFKKK